MKLEVDGLFRRGLLSAAWAFSNIVGVSICAGAFAAGYHFYKHARKRLDEEHENLATLLDARELLEIFVPVADVTGLPSTADELGLTGSGRETTHIWFLHRTDDDRQDWLVTNDFNAVMEAEREVITPLRTREDLAEQIIRVPTGVFALMMPSLCNGECLGDVTSLLTVHLSFNNPPNDISMTTIRLLGRSDAVTAATTAMLEGIDVASAALVFAANGDNNSTA